MALFELRNIKKVYRLGNQDVRALDGIDLDIHEGEFLGIIGPSGSGKSTMLQMLGCLDTPTSGTIHLDGVDITKASGHLLSRMRNKKIGFVFQAFNLLGKLNVQQNVELPMIYAGVGGRERKERALAAIEAVGLSERIKNRPNQLSGGQAQRVAIARALVNNPKIMLADEPTGALDSQTGEAILQLFRELHKKGITVAIVTHDPDIAAECPRRVELKDGKIVHDSSSPGKGGV